MARRARAAEHCRAPVKGATFQPDRLDAAALRFLQTQDLPEYEECVYDAVANADRHRCGAEMSCVRQSREAGVPVWGPTGGREVAGPPVG